MAEKKTQQKKPPSGNNSPPTETTGAPTLSGEPLKDVSGTSETEAERTPRGAVQEVAESRQPDRLSPHAQSAALEWFLGEVASAAEAETKTMKLNMGSDEKPRWIEWTIRSVDMDFMRRTRREAMNTREARRTGNVDEYRVNLQVVVQGTVDPNIQEAATTLFQQGTVTAPDPVEAVRAAFQKKPGYVARLSAEIMGLSGFDEEDVQEATALEAAKNS
jgi:hypothetical protein